MSGDFKKDCSSVVYISRTLANYGPDEDTNNTKSGSLYIKNTFLSADGFLSHVLTGSRNGAGTGGGAGPFPVRPRSRTESCDAVLELASRRQKVASHFFDPLALTSDLHDGTTPGGVGSSLSGGGSSGRVLRNVEEEDALPFVEPYGEFEKYLSSVAGGGSGVVPSESNTVTAAAAAAAAMMLMVPSSSSTEDLGESDEESLKGPRDRNATSSFFGSLQFETPTVSCDTYFDLEPFPPTTTATPTAADNRLPTPHKRHGAPCPASPSTVADAATAAVAAASAYAPLLSPPSGECLESRRSTPHPSECLPFPLEDSLMSTVLYPKTASTPFDFLGNAEKGRAAVSASFPLLPTPTGRGPAPPPLPLSTAAPDPLLSEFLFKSTPVLSSDQKTSRRQQRKQQRSSPNIKASPNVVATFPSENKVSKRSSEPLSCTPLTTIMLRNIPNKYTQLMLLEVINEKFEGLYDFFYLPIDFRNRCNVGYAFINFTSPQHGNPLLHIYFVCFSALKFKETFNGLKLGAFRSNKICQVSWGRVQGLEANIEHYRNSAVMSIPIAEYKPMLFNNGVAIAFPNSDRPLPSVKLRPQKC